MVSCVPDDTCYQIGFDRLEDAEVILRLLSSMQVTNFIRSISFPDSKRTITKDILMRINLGIYQPLSTINTEPLLFETWNAQS